TSGPGAAQIPNSHNSESASTLTENTSSRISDTTPYTVKPKASIRASLPTCSDAANEPPGTGRLAAPGRGAAAARPAIHENTRAFAGTYKLKSARLWVSIASSAPRHARPNKRESVSRPAPAVVTQRIKTRPNTTVGMTNPTTPSSESD